MVGHDGAVSLYLIHKGDFGLLEFLGSLGLHGGEDLLGVSQKIVDGVDVGGMEGQGDHGFHLVKINVDHGVIVSHVGRGKLLVLLGSAVNLVVLLDHFIGDPDGGQAGCLGGHDVDAVSEVDGKSLHTRSHEFQHLVLNKAVSKGGAHQSQRHVVRADALLGGAVEVDHNHLGAVHVVGVLQKLLDQLGAALTHAHSTQGAVAGVGVRAEDHSAAPCQLFSCVGVDDRLVGGDVDTSVFFGGGQTEHVVVLVDGTAHGAEAVVAVCHGVGNGKFLESAGTGSLDDTHVGDIVTHKSIKLNLELIHVARRIVGLQDGVSDGTAASLFGGNRGGFGGDSADKIHPLVIKRYCFHINTSDEKTDTLLYHFLRISSRGFP